MRELLNIRLQEENGKVSCLLAMGYDGNRELLSDRPVPIPSSSCKCSELLFPYQLKKL